MARTYREIAIEQMLGTVEEAMSQAIDWWGNLLARSLAMLPAARAPQQPTLPRRRAA
jgi:hypothetical protein